MLTTKPPALAQINLLRTLDPIDVVVAGRQLWLIIEVCPGQPSRWTIGDRWPWGVREAGQA